jgi:hypothetical protein
MRGLHLTHLQLFLAKNGYFRGGDHRFVLYLQGSVSENGLWGRPSPLTSYFHV